MQSEYPYHPLKHMEPLLIQSKIKPKNFINSTDPYIHLNLLLSGKTSLIKITQAFSMVTYLFQLLQFCRGTGYCNSPRGGLTIDRDSPVET